MQKQSSSSPEGQKGRMDIATSEMMDIAEIMDIAHSRMKM